MEGCRKTLPPGTKLGNFEVGELLGVGGMGEVYRARDSKLGREVAIKVLPEKFSGDKDRLERFEREARTLASINHPNIAVLHGLEREGETSLLVMEMVSGETLEERLKRGPIPLDESVFMFAQIAEGLEAAHEQGLVHRDLKPANVKITDEGRIKILDFGLAKPLSIVPSPVPDGQTQSVGPTPKEITTDGMILGTPAYMSPEQARGKPVDRRTDVWAFGCVLYECLTGRGAFGGEAVADVLAAIVERDPEWHALPAGTPHHVRWLLRRCLDKDPRGRLRDIGEARVVLADPIGGGAPAPSPARASGRRWLWPALAGALALAWIASLGLRKDGSSGGPVGPAPMLLDLSLDEALDRSGRVRRKIALSRDGTRLAYVAWEAGNSLIRVRELQSGETVTISDHDGAHSPFFSPDGHWVGFFSQGLLRKARADGGAIMTLCPAPGATYGGAWSEDGTIVFATDGTRLMQVSSQGGAPRRVAFAGLPETALVWPHFLPGTRQLLVTTEGAIAGQPGPHLLTLSLDTGETKPLVRGVDGRVVASGHLIYQLDRTLFAAAFDPGELALASPPAALATRIGIDNVGALTCGVSDDGLLIYQPQGEEEQNRLVWVDRSGVSTPVIDEQRSFGVPRLSPGGDRIAWGGLVTESTAGDLWVLDHRRGSISRETFESFSGYPAWTPDGRRLAFTSTRSGLQYRMYVKGVDDDRPAERLGTHDETSVPCDFSPDGTALLYYEVRAETQRDIFLWPLEGPEPIPLVVTEHNERAPRFSRGGRWFAYVSDETGSDEVFVRRFPEGGRRWKISVGGGREPVWNPAADELFYRAGESMMSVRYRISADGATFEPDPPVELFRRACLPDPFGNANFDVDIDGSRFVMVQGPEPIFGRLHVVTRWFDEIERALAGDG